MTREQRDQVRQRRVLGSNKANWFSLFSILLPDVPTDGANGYKAYSPCKPPVTRRHLNDNAEGWIDYTTTDFAYALPTPASGPTPGSGQTPSFLQQETDR